MGATVQPFYSSASPVTCLPAPLWLAFLILVPGAGIVSLFGGKGPPMRVRGLLAGSSMCFVIS